MTASAATPEPTLVALEALGISKRFHAGQREVPALHNVNFNVRHGVVTGLIGPDGAGKTTLMRLAAGLLTPDAGRLTVLGLDATRDSLKVQAQLGYMPQHFGLYEDLSVQENLDLYADLQGVPRRSRTQRYRELMHMTGLAPFTGRLAGRLSGGMKQKLGLACTLVRAPRLLLLDEPTVGVDPVSRRELWAIVYRLLESEGMSVLLSTAYLDEAERCEDVVLLHQGRVLSQGPPAALGARMQGRTFSVTAPNLKKRELQSIVSGLPGVIDTVIQGAHVRIVTAAVDSPPVESIFAAAPSAQLTAIAPRFEDGFVALLHESANVRSVTPAVAVHSPNVAQDAHDVVIEVHDVKRRFGDFYAVDGVTFDVHRGEIFGLLGPNGAGKSTTFRMLCGLLPASAGML
ncbi:MAG: ATP-binding cassette domain-containing protein, partial [Burkholderiales bacterium]